MSTTTLLLLLLLLACPLSMLFMHRGGGHAHGSHGGAQPEAGEGQGSGHEAHGVPLREATGQDKAVSEETRHTQGACGHKGGTGHERPAGGAAA